MARLGLALLFGLLAASALAQPKPPPHWPALTNAFKKGENLGHAIALHFMFYNFGRIHQTLRVTPAMEAGLADHVWSLEEIAALTDQASVRPQPFQEAGSLSNAG